MAITVVLLVSAALQFVAALLALRLIRVTGKRTAWVLIAAALFFMAIRRSIALFRVLSGELSPPPDPVAEAVALGISILMVAGIAGIRPLFRSIRRSGDALRESRRTLETLLSNLPGMAYRCRNDRDWTMEFVSDGCHALTGYRAADLTHNTTLSYGQLIHPEDRETVWNEVQAALEAPVKRPFELVYRITTSAGEEKWVWEQGRGVHSEDGELLALEGYVTDITDRRRLEQQLLAAQKMEAIGRLAGGVAHDFNNLLTIITAQSELVLDELGPGNPIRAEIEELQKAAARAATLTRQLLAFGRRQVTQPRALDLNAVVSDLDKMLRRVIGEDIELATALAPDLGCVKADPGQVEQVLMNLVVNARDAMPEGGRLTIETANVELDDEYVKRHVAVEPGPYVMLAVSDTGIGMDKATQAKIFEPFFTTKGPGRGTGLGLASVYGIVKQAGGNVWVYSEPGRGTTFKIYLPRVDEPAETFEPAPRNDAHTQGTETVLLVEDDAAVRTVIRRVLERNGYTVLEAESGNEAVALCERYESAIHLLLTDMVMPEMTGGKLAECVKAMRPELRVLCISGYTDRAAIRNGVLAAGVPFLAKPFSAQSLARKVREVLDSPADPTGRGP